MNKIDFEGRCVFDDPDLCITFDIEPNEVKYQDHGFYKLAFARDKADQIESLKTIPGMRFSLISDYPKDPFIEVLINVDDVEFIGCQECDCTMPARETVETCPKCGSDDLSGRLLHEWPYPDHY